MNIRFLAKKIYSTWNFRRTNKQKYLNLQSKIPPFFKSLYSKVKKDKRFVFFGMGMYDPKLEAIICKVLEYNGYEVHILTGYEPGLADAFSLFGIKNIHYIESYVYKYRINKTMKKAQSIIDSIKTPEQLLKDKIQGISYGKFAISTYMRQTRSSGVTIEEIKTDPLLKTQLFSSLSATYAVEELLNELKPDMMCMIDRGYTAAGQLFEAALARKIPVFTWNSAHKSGYEILKMYTSPEMTSTHPQSLSNNSWEQVKNIQWTKEKWMILHEEIYKAYNSGDWFQEVGTQVDKKIYTKEQLVDLLGLDGAKKTVGLFPHMFWDATFFWGKDLFRDYYEWFVEVLKIAAKKDHLNWIIKIHPANILKAKRDNYTGDHKELTAVYDVLGEIPEHIKLIEPENDINTYALFEVLDCCLTVRGTIGIEAAMFGINTITAGTGRYDQLGFTYDFDSREEYLAFLEERLEALAPMSEEMVGLARKFAYGVFILRPLEQDVFFKTEKQMLDFTRGFSCTVDTRQSFEETVFFRGLNDFIRMQREDYLDVGML